MKDIVNSFSAMSGVIISQWCCRWEAPLGARYDVIKALSSLTCALSSTSHFSVVSLL